MIIIHKRVVVFKNQNTFIKIKNEGKDIHKNNQTIVNFIHTADTPITQEVIKEQMSGFELLC